MGKVTENYDKDHPGMVKVDLYLREDGQGATEWVPVLMGYAGKKHGAYMLPEVGDIVVIGFLGGETGAPVVLGSLWHIGDEMPESTVEDKNNFKSLTTREGLTVTILDESGKVKVEVKTPNELTLTMDDDAKVITLKDKDGKNKLEISNQDGKVTIEAEKGIELKSGGATVTLDGNGNSVSIEATDVTAEASAGLTLKGNTTDLKGTTTTVESTGTLDVKASGMTNVKGSMVKIN